MKKSRYAAITAVPGIILAVMAIWARYDNVVGNFCPRGITCRSPSS